MNIEELLTKYTDLTHKPMKSGSITLLMTTRYRSR
nr:MAG TPA: hypothetical protein [Caudoviricetes sp.]